MRKDWMIASPGPIALADSAPGDTGGKSQEQVQGQLGGLHNRLAELQELLYGAGKQSVLIVLQGPDTSGKDGTIKHVMTPLKPLGCQVASFKAPSAVERRHDFLWRVRQQVPATGMIAIFNRSHYEDGLVARVHELVSPEEWKGRYEEINQFERMFARNGTLILKFFLHLSHGEQEKRLRAREPNPEKSWKLSVDDWRERTYWDAYRLAYEDALGRCGTRWAPCVVYRAGRPYVVSQLPHCRSRRAALRRTGAGLA
jgi:PPK2 family polyphosphate:nucleotide phosphotransferase